MLPLDGIKVLDLTRVLAGPWCTQTLADLGADVWKVEAPGQGDETRTWTNPGIGGESTYFLCCNRSKRSIAIDLKSERGRDLVRALAREADVLVENFRKGALDRMGLGYGDLAAIHPGLVYCSISGYGREGPRAEEPGYDFVIQAESGLMAITGEAEGEPMKLGVAITDLVTGMSAVQAVLAALMARSRSGQGQFIDMALFDTAVTSLANVASGHLNTGAAPKRYGNAHPSVVPYQIFATKDADIALAVGNDSQFRAFCEKVLEEPDLARDERFSTVYARTVHREAIVDLVARALKRQTTAHWMARLRAAGVPAGKVREVPDVFASPEAAARGLVVEVPDARHGTLRLMRSPLGLAGTPPRAPVAPPRLGEHTDEILAEALGFGAEERAALREAGVVSGSVPA